MESIAPIFPTKPLASGKRQHTRAEWQAKRDIIKKLYMDERLPLPKVMEIMQSEYDFKATYRRTKMYKQRLNEWGFKKNCNASEMKRIFHSMREMEALGRGREDMTPEETADYKRLVKYMNRKYLHPCLAQASLTRTISAPKALEVPEILFASISNYISGSFEAGIWTVPNSAEIINYKYRGGVIIPMVNYLMTALRMFEYSDSQFMAGSILSKAFSLVDRVLLEEDPRTLSTFISFILRFENHHPDIISHLIRHLSSYANSLFPLQHPLRSIFTQISILDYTTWSTVLTRAWAAAFDLIGKFVGFNHLTRLIIASLLSPACIRELALQEKSDLLSESDLYQLRGTKLFPEKLRSPFIRVIRECNLYPYKKESKELALQVIKLSEVPVHLEGYVLSYLAWIFNIEKQFELAESTQESVLSCVD